MKAPNVSEPWYALRIRSHYENTVASHLHARGFESFLPLYLCRRRWSDRFKEFELPLFPGYVFCRFDPLNRLPILSIPGVVKPVAIGRTPVPVDDSEIAAIQAAVKTRLRTSPWPYLRVGQRVRIERGPLCGIEGILVGFRGQARLVLSASLLQSSIAVQVEENWVRPLQKESALATRVVSSCRTSLPSRAKAGFRVRHSGEPPCKAQGKQAEPAPE
jgi:transcription antitermination factor NusG